MRHQVVVAGLIAAVAVFVALFFLSGGVANVVGSGMAHTEKTAVSTLRTIHWAQGHFQAGAFVDADGDGVGEFGSLAWLAARAPLPGGAALPAPLLQVPGSGFVGDVLQAQGYCFRTELPDDADGRERRFVAWAWPRLRAAGAKAFCIDQREDILERAEGHGWIGCENGPPPGACPTAEAVDAGVPGWGRWRGKTSRKVVGALD